MNKNAEVDYGIACSIVNGRSSTENEMRMAKATISALAEKGHRSAIAKIMEDPDSYDADIDKMIGEIGD